MPAYYEIRLKGHLDLHWLDWFDGLELKHLDGDQTLLSGLLPDQTALHSLLNRIRDLNMPLISVKQVERSDQESDQEINQST